MGGVLLTFNASLPRTTAVRRAAYYDGACVVQSQVKETGLSIRRRPLGAKPPGSDDAAAAGDKDIPGQCDSCGTNSAPAWDVTTVVGMSLCPTCSAALGGQ